MFIDRLQFVGDLLEASIAVVVRENCGSAVDGIAEFLEFVEKFVRFLTDVVDISFKAFLQTIVVNGNSERKIY
jgi:hypothetical protein